MDKKGKVYLVGAGPGDPDLITWEGLKLLQICDVLIYDRLASPRLLNFVKAGCEKIYVGKASGKHSMKQEEINRIIVEKALTSPIVVRLKGGDPFVFGRGGEEVLALQEYGIPYKIVPGITSAIASATYAGIPITHRGASQSFHVITGHTSDEQDTLPEDLKNLTKCNGTLVFLMGLGNIKKIRDELLTNGKPEDTPAAVIENATTIWQREVRGTLKDIVHKVEEAKIKSPAVIVIGEVAKLDLRADKDHCLSGVKIGITGTKVITDKLAGRLEELDAKVEVVLSSNIIEYQDNPLLDKSLHSLEQYSWIVFTSTNSVHIFFRKLKELKIDYRRLSKLKFAVVGSGTEQALQQQGFQSDFIPTEYTVTCLAKELSRLVSNREWILIPRAKQGSEELLHIFEEQFKSFVDIKLYDIQTEIINMHDNSEEIGTYDYLTFASSSGVRGYMSEMSSNLEKIKQHTRFVCIGKATQETLVEYGVQEILMAKEANVQGLVDIICEDHLSRLVKESLHDSGSEYESQ